MHEERLYMPVEVTVDKQYLKGYGKKEMIAVVKTALLSVTNALLIGAIAQSIYIIVLLVIVALGLSCMLHYKDGVLNLTAAEHIVIMVDYLVKQKVFHYKYYDEWRRDKCAES